jgi:hypothetical protein
MAVTMMIVVDEHRAGDRRLEPGATPETTILPPARTSPVGGRLAVVRHLAREAIREMMTHQSAGTPQMTIQAQVSQAEHRRASVMMTAPTAVPVSSNNGRTRLTMP